MTLVTRPKPAPHTKKISGKHRRQSKQYHKAYWPYIPLLLVVGVGMLLNMSWHPYSSVLGYATDMSLQSLLDDTNAQRASYGLGALALNNQLDQAAQVKANDMIARDYWSHNTPDGQAPWSFISATGYAYQTAGENLAYGFPTAADTLTGWMNSPEHKDNILNTTYLEVGFGFANGSNYQSGGPETVVVAMYAKPASGAVANATPPAATPAPSPAPAQVKSAAQSSSGGAAPATASTPAAANTPAKDVTSSDVATPTNTSTSKTATPVLGETPSKPITRIQLLTAGKLPWSSMAVTLIALVGLTIFLLRHGFAWHKFLIKGEKFVLHHKVLDIAIVALVVAGFILTRSSGFIR